MLCKDIVHLFTGDYKEGYYIGVAVPEDDPRAQRAFIGPNAWPAAGNFGNNASHMDEIHF